jgi:hypothetical protein
MTDLRLSEPKDYNIFFFLRFDGPSFVGLLKTVTPAIDERFTNMQEAVTRSQRVSITLFYLDGGNTSEDLKFTVLDLLSPLEFLC